MIRVAHAAEDFLGHLFADLIVRIEAEALGFGIPSLRRRFPNVVEQDREGEVERGGVE